MPTYVYQCENCGVQFEHRQRVTDEPLTICPECDGHVRRVLQPVGIVFKGSGWYCTDHRAKSPTALPGESKSSAAKASDDGSKKADEGSKSTGESTKAEAA